jgi:hypothetical protein
MDPKAQSEQLSIPIGSGVSGSDVEGGLNLPRTEGEMSKTVAVMQRKRVDLDPGNITFVMLEDDHDTVVRTVKIDQQTWEDLGRPDTVTVTIQPGDLLN